MIVGKKSATYYPGRYRDKKKLHIEGINRAHFGIIKFQGPQDEVYHFQILPWLRRLQEKSKYYVHVSIVFLMNRLLNLI